MFSNDLLSGNPNSFAYYTFHDGIGFINDSSYAVYSLTTDSYIIQEGINPGEIIKKDWPIYNSCLVILTSCSFYGVRNIEDPIHHQSHS